MATDFRKGLPASTQTPSSPLVTRLSNLGAALSDVEAAVRHEELFEELRMELEMESTLAASLGKQARELEGELENSKGSVERLEAEAARLQKELHVAQAQLALLGEQPAQSVRTMGMLSRVGIGAARRGASATVPCWSVAASASSPLTVWGRVNSANVQKVLWALDELAVPYKRVDAGMAFCVVDTEDYLAMNPNGRIPTIDDNGTVLFESNVIVRYLGNKYAGEDSVCWPADPAKKAQADMYMDLQQTQLSTDSSLVFAQMFRTPPEKRDMTAVEAAAARLANEYLKVCTATNDQLHKAELFNSCRPRAIHIRPPSLLMVAAGGNARDQAVPWGGGLHARRYSTWLLGEPIFAGAPATPPLPLSKT